MKVFLWIYAITGTVYFMGYQMGSDIVVKYAVGPMWLLMMVAPVVLMLLIVLPFLGPVAQRLGLFDS